MYLGSNARTDLGTHDELETISPETRMPVASTVTLLVGISPLLRRKRSSLLASRMSCGFWLPIKDRVRYEGLLQHRVTAIESRNINTSTSARIPKGDPMTRNTRFWEPLTPLIVVLSRK